MRTPRHRATIARIAIPVLLADFVVGDQLTSPSGRVFKDGTVAVGAARLGSTIEIAIRTLNQCVEADVVLVLRI
jgi:hypothetical protein